MKYIYKPAKYLRLFIFLIPLVIQAQINNANEEVSLCDVPKPGIVYDGRALTTDTSECYVWPFQGDAWQLQSITINNYNEEAMLIRAVKMTVNPQTQQLEKATRYVYTYHEDNSLKSEIFQLWNSDLLGGIWDNTQKETFAYNESGALDIKQSWYSTFGDTSWQGGQKNFFSYNDHGKKDTWDPLESTCRHASLSIL